MTSPRRKLDFYIPLLVALGSLTLLFLAAWRGWLGEWAHAGSQFGEAARPGWIKQPVNTWSNLGFVFTGLCIGWLLMRGDYSQNKNALTQTRFYAPFFASLVVYLGPGSMAMHATETRLGAHLDMVSMYLVASFLIAYSMTRFFRLNWLCFLLLFLAGVEVCLRVEKLPHWMPVVGYMGNFIFGLFIVVATLFEGLNSWIRKTNCDWTWGAFSLGVLLLALLIWKLSQDRTPTQALFQGHAVWHVLCAVSVYGVFRFYVSENPGPKGTNQARRPGECPLRAE
jgi:hypothetical protein